MKSNKTQNGASIWILIVLRSLAILNLWGLVTFSWALCRYPILTIPLRIVLWCRLTLHFALSFNTQAGLWGNSKILPARSPSFLWGILPQIETIRVFIRRAVLTLRVTANIVAGHILIILRSKLFWAISFTLLFILIPFEVVVAVLQAAIFSILLISYAEES